MVIFDSRFVAAACSTCKRDVGCLAERLKAVATAPGAVAPGTQVTTWGTSPDPLKFQLPSRGDGPESTYCGRSRPRPWTPQLGGKYAYRVRLGKDRSPERSRHSLPG